MIRTRLTLSLILALLASPLALAETVVVPPPPPMIESNSVEPDPEVTIVNKPDATVAEYRVNGRLFMMKVTPKIGKEYYLVDENGSGSLVRKDTIGTNLHVPQWVLKRF